MLRGRRVGLHLQGVAFDYYDMDGGGFIDHDEFRKLAPTLVEQVTEDPQ